MEEEEKKPEEVPDTQVNWPVDVAIDIVLNDTRYSRTVKVNEDMSVDLGDMNTEGVVTYLEDCVTYSAVLISDALKGEALHKSGRFDDEVAQCCKTKLWLEKDRLVITHDGDYLVRNLSREFHDEWYFKGEGTSHTYRGDDGYRDSFLAPQ